jgi:hypothetical protein
MRSEKIVTHTLGGVEHGTAGKEAGRSKATLILASFPV